MSKKNNFILLSVALLMLSLSGFLLTQGINYFDSELFQRTQIESDLKGVATESAILNQEVEVKKVVDGDTIQVEIKGESKTIRFIGINTPETVDPRRPVQCFGVEASNETKKLLEGKKVILEKDVSETDKYNRLLRYVFLRLDDGQLLFVNDYLVREGFANSSSYPPDIKYQKQFDEAQEVARNEQRGLWSKCN